MQEWTEWYDRINNSFNIRLNTYIHMGIVQTCGHRDWEDCECDGMKFAGKSLVQTYREKGWKLSDHS